MRDAEHDSPGAIEMKQQSRAPVALRGRVAEIVAITDAVCAKLLDDEYAQLARTMAERLAWTLLARIEHGRAASWAGGILLALGRINFLFDPSQRPHVTRAQLTAAVGVSAATMSTFERTIREALDLIPMHPDWTRPSQLADNPLVWIVEVDGLPVDVRFAPRAVQEAALEAGLIPYLPATSEEWEEWEEDAARVEAAADAMDDRADEQADDRTGSDPHEPTGNPILDELLADIMSRPGGRPQSIEALNAALQTAAIAYNDRPQRELGGLSPLQVDRLIRADWTTGDGVITLDESLPFADLAPAATFHDARLLLGMLLERGDVKATPNGNLPRAFVAEFRDRMELPDWRREGAYWLEQRTLNEDDIMPLHIMRLLAQIAGIVKLYDRRFSVTRKGRTLHDESRAGELFALLVRTHFRQLNLANMDGAGAAPEFQHAIGAMLYSFAHAGEAWRSPAEWCDRLLLPYQRDAIPTDIHFDRHSFLMESRFLRPMFAFGLAETQRASEQRIPRFWHGNYRPSALLGRLVRFQV